MVAYFFESSVAKNKLGSMPMVKNQSNLITISCEASRQYLIKRISSKFWVLTFEE